jgi:hypothetical protein
LSHKAVNREPSIVPQSRLTAQEWGHAAIRKTGMTGMVLRETVYHRAAAADP